MSDRIKKIKIRQLDGSVSDYIPIGADALNIDTKRGESVQSMLDKTARYYNSVEEMKLDENIQIGDKCATLGYYEPNDGGGAIFYILSDEDLTKFQIKIGSLYATLLNENINIKMLGAKGDGITDDTNYLKECNKFKKVFLSEGTYNLTDIIDFSNIELIGTNECTINCISQTTVREHQIRFQEKCIIKNINFIQNHETVLLIVEDSYDCLFENCKFIVNGYKTNGYFDLYQNNKNCKVINCYFEINSIKDNEPQIGGVWVRQMNEETFSENILFENCEFNVISSKDETVAIWNSPGKVSNVKLINCHFYSSNDNAVNPFILRLDGEKNVEVINCTFELNNEQYGKSSVFRNLQDRIKPIIKDCYIKTNHNFINGITIGYLFLDGVIFESTDTEKVLNLNDINYFSEFYNCNFKLQSGIRIRNSILKKCILDINGTLNCDFNIMIYDTIIKNLIIPDNYIINQTSNEMDNFIMSNVKITLSPNNINTANFFVFNGNHLIKNFIIENSNIIGTLYQLGESVGYVINNTITKELNTFDNIKQNNNFMII